VVFDCDGVLVDSDRISLRVQAEWISALGLETSYENCVRDFRGLGMPATLQILAERLGGPLPSDWEESLDSAVRDGFRPARAPEIQLRTESTDSKNRGPLLWVLAGGPCDSGQK
jgi:beta-phosphoglucomutase-like phosphatase (HAD superfamily)